MLLVYYSIMVGLGGAKKDLGTSVTLVVETFESPHMCLLQLIYSINVNDGV